MGTKFEFSCSDDRPAVVTISLSVSFKGYWQKNSGKWEGENKTVITVFDRPVGTLLSPVYNNQERWLWKVVT